MSWSDELATGIAKTRHILLQFGRLPLLLTVIWIWVVRWNEITVFQSAVRPCRWETWETWPVDAQPHRVLLIADPQLVDPHTYPGRPWPLSQLTVFYTDLYLKRAYKNLLGQLHPHSTLFLGDLFDGGREWGAVTYTSPEEQYQHLGNDFWLKEYRRFMNLFAKPWHDTGLARVPAEGGRRLIASLPGNHDLGFAAMINPQVKSRFEAHFGPLNRIDVIGNHSFVSLDTVSLSATELITPEGSSGIGYAPNKDIWQPAQDFLQDVSMQRARAIDRFLQHTNRAWPAVPSKHSPTVQKVHHEYTPQPFHPPQQPQISTTLLPTILLTHVPLYRSDTAHCGPHRERGSSIPISAGYQYQNVLTPLVTKLVVDQLDPKQITMVYSGDDHDYCEIEHMEFSGGFKEITVKSMSWAMGVRKPGVQLVSLWNPVNSVDVMINNMSEPRRSMPRDTVQNRLCLLPDQLGVFVTYAQLLGLTLSVLIIRVVLYKPVVDDDSSDDKDEKGKPLLPLSHDDQSHITTSTCSTSAHSSDSLTRTTSTTSRNIATKLGGYGDYGRSRSQSPSQRDGHTTQKPTRRYSNTQPRAHQLPLIARATGYNEPDLDTDDYGIPRYINSSTRRRRWNLNGRTKKAELAKSTIRIAVVVLSYYVWCLWFS